MRGALTTSGVVLLLGRGVFLATLSWGLLRKQQASRDKHHDSVVVGPLPHPFLLTAQNYKRAPGSPLATHAQQARPALGVGATTPAVAPRAARVGWGPPGATPLPGSVHTLSC